MLSAVPVSSVIKFFLDLPKRATMEPFPETLTLVNKNLSSVKERFKRLRAQLNKNTTVSMPKGNNNNTNEESNVAKANNESNVTKASQLSVKNKHEELARKKRKRRIISDSDSSESLSVVLPKPQTSVKKLKTGPILMQPVPEDRGRKRSKEPKAEMKISSLSDVAEKKPAGSLVANRMKKLREKFSNAPTETKPKSSAESQKLKSPVKGGKSNLTTADQVTKKNHPQRDPNSPKGTKPNQSLSPSKRSVSPRVSPRKMPSAKQEEDLKLPLKSKAKRKLPIPPKSSSTAAKSSAALPMPCLDTSPPSTKSQTSVQIPASPSRKLPKPRVASPASAEKAAVPPVSKRHSKAFSIIEKRLANPQYKIPKKPVSVALVPPASVEEAANLGVEDMDVDTASSHCPSPGPVELCSVEEMDWEVNELRKDFEDSQQPTFLTTAVQKSSGSNWTALTEGGSWVLVIDTNVYISALPFVQKIRDTNINGLGFPVIYVPHRVLCELDALKDNVRKSIKNPDVSRSARLAVKFLNSSLAERHPRIKGQTLKNYVAMDDIRIDNSDDKILLSCLQLQKAQPHKQVILLSNDINLRTKATIEAVESFSVSEFEENVMKDGSLHSVPKLSLTLLRFRCKKTLITLLKEILRSECDVSSDSFEESFSAFVQKWVTHFSSWLPAIAEEHLQALREAFLEETNGLPGALGKVMECASLFFSHFVVNGKSYYNHIEKGLDTLNCFRRRATELDPPKEDKHYVGALNAVFSQCWAAINNEVVNVQSSMTTGNGFAKAQMESVVQGLENIIASLRNIISYSILEVGSSPAVPALVSRLAPYTKDVSAEDMERLIRKTSITLNGRNAISHAANIFDQSMVNIRRHSSLGGPRSL